MATLHPGPFCEELGLLSAHLKDNNICQIQKGSLKNGHVLELKTFADKLGLPCSHVIQWIQTLQPQSNANYSTLKYRITNTIELNKKLNSKKKVIGFKSAKQFKCATFNVNDSAKCYPSSKANINDTDVCKSSQVEGCGSANITIEKHAEGKTESTVSVRNEPLVHVDSAKNVDSQDTPNTDQNIMKDVKLTKEQMKDVNLLEYEIKKKEKELRKMQALVSGEREMLKKLQMRKGHYSVRNVEKRDVRALKTRQQLREAKTTIFKQKEVLDHFVRKERKTRKRNRKLKNDLVNRNSDNDRARRSMLNSEDHVQQLLLENENLRQIINEQNTSHLKKKKSVNYFKRSLNKFRSGLKTNDTIRKLMKTVAEKEKDIQDLVTNIEYLQENLNDNFQTKNSDSSFSDSVRLCVMELAGLEVAVEKIPKVIQTISSHLFSRNIASSDLPSSSTTQTIIDEGHYLAKKFIASKIESAESFGINRDGTTRKKQKVLDTSVTLDTGEVLSLGFTRVAHETAKTINEVTKSHVHEMSEIQTNKEPEESDDFIRNTLGKLSFSMSDRASNEKAADRLLDEWRDDVLNLTPESDTEKVKHFHCMAHVLLGFHKYSCDDLKKVENKITDENGPLGRDSLPQFKSWRKSGTVVERVVRTVSDTFGPAGDHLGVRDRWEAYCSEKGVKSVIGNYRDNRFNGIFQTSAEVLLHADDMVEVLDTVHQPNRKLISVKADLQCTIIRTLLTCFGLFYMKVTGPYWNLVTSGAVPYLMLHSHIQTLSEYLKTCITNSETLLSPKRHWESDDVLGISDIPGRKYFEKHLLKERENKELLYEFIKVVSSAMLRCIEKQLSDFMPGGQFSQTPSEEDLNRTKYAHSTNLGCEHHFGDLDSSQKRRPNATMHHHSSVQLLKRNRSKMINWLTEMPLSDRSNVLKLARKGGKSLRETHLKAEKDVISVIHNDMLNDKQKKGKKRKRQENEMSENEPNFEFDQEMSQEDYKINEYVIVAYQDTWYPGIIEKNTEDFLMVNFLAATRNPGFFTWPARKDVQRVAKDFVIKRDFLPECRNSGRLWFIDGHEYINSVYQKYSKVYF